jgi:DNA-binding CsgD family transcriptional regulator
VQITDEHEVCKLFRLRGEQVLTQAEIASRLGLSLKDVRNILIRWFDVHEREEHRCLARSKGQNKKAINHDALHSRIESLFDRTGEDILPVYTIAKMVGMSTFYVTTHLRLVYDEDELREHEANVRFTIKARQVSGARL